MGSKVARNSSYRSVPEEFQRHNAERTAQGVRLRNAIAAMMIESPHILAREVRAKLNAHELGRRSLPRKRAIQLHMQAIRGGRFGRGGQTAKIRVQRARRGRNS